ncbi:phenylalanine--tRNA ligase subunit beta [Dethiosulfatarculus sandiegensis]|uniref:Phenylalanine--tRNA ligase beta subunit n=1 Tax=Dethiosulfatarculus sandiegensis TaxID=1429043 RepID=A0A0D2J6Y9_9BACT|nr:phenylalanine--tRNA ligase subunit beta [Dethiosulfatarculus sandiegensis]KIX11441.1 phenylalanyl-tRNA synthetase subunit beta [Dethiosulfatarculus sandiegensis]
MLVPVKWLREFVDSRLSASEMADALTMSGLEVDGVIERHQGLDKVICAKVLDVSPHPGADRLRLADVDTGSEKLTIVCGAPNLEKGMVSALALPGAVLAEGMKVKKTKIRGVESVGMLCSLSEMGISADHSGIVDLPRGLAPGTPILDALNLETEVLEISITPNRGDSLSILGVARDLAAIEGLPVKMPEISFEESDQDINDYASVSIKAPEACHRYAARLVQNVKIAPSPIWMADRISAIGMRPISNVVDITNYVMMEMGQPLHGFDFRQVAKGQISVRLADEGEVFTTLDNQERKLQKGMALICDGDGPVALAGVMGGLNSEIADDTETVLIESAFFDPLITRRTSKRLNLSTESAYRFERGIDLEGCSRAAERAAQLMADFADGQVAKGMIDEYPRPYQAPKLELSVKDTSRFLGMELDKEAVTTPLVRLGVKVGDGPDEDIIIAEPPAWRTDLERPVDLTEEIARLGGFNRIDDHMPLAPLMAKPRAWNQRVRENAKDLLTAMGMDEAITYSFDLPDSVRKMGFAEEDSRSRVVSLMNPLSEELSVLRTSLLPGLLLALRRNLGHKARDVAMFEVGKVFWDFGEKQPTEPSRLSGVFCGLAQPANWWTGETKVELAHAKGAVEFLVQGLGIKGLSFDTEGGPQPYVQGGDWCRALLDGEYFGDLARFDDKTLAGFDIDQPAYFFDLDFDLLVEKASEAKEFHHLPRYPEIVRDLAVVVDEAVGAGDILASAEDLAKGKAKKWLRKVELFDIYRGKPLQKGQKSLGLRFTYRDANRTLTEKEVIKVHDDLVEKLLAAHGGVIRQ